MKRFFRYFFWLFFALLIFLIILSAFLFVGSTKPAEKIEWGVTFGHSQAESLGVDWQETYLALLDDVGVRNVRLPIYWDELEAERNDYNFSAWDWQLEELEKRGGKAILVIGFKLPRWPECRMPSYLEGINSIGVSKELFQMLRVVVLHYKDNPTVWAWQVENEPLLKFGICPPKDKELLDAEIKLVRNLDPSRPIIITDTGENSAWVEAGKRADIFGSTLYRIIHDPTLGFVHYPYPPIMYHRKSLWLGWLFPHVRAIFTEVQAEPWVTAPPISNHSLEVQYKTLSPELFRANIEYVRQTGFDTAYLWGAEWWYWTKKVAGTDEIWDVAKEVFKEDR